MRILFQLLSVFQRVEEEGRRRASVSDEAGGGGRKWSDSIREARTRSGVTEAVWVGHRRQICELAVNGFSILELNYAICLLGLVLPLSERFKLHVALWALMSFFFLGDNTAHKKRFSVTFQTQNGRLEQIHYETPSWLLWPCRGRGEADLGSRSSKRNLTEPSAHC